MPSFVKLNEIPLKQNPHTDDPTDHHKNSVPMVLNPNDIEPTFLKLDSWSSGAGLFLLQPPIY